MEFKQLEAFFHVAELGSFTRAATVLDTNQPALSRLVRQLENELRQNLLLRNGRGVVMTDSGQVLLAHAKGIVQQVERAKQDLKERRGVLSGHFSLGLLPSVSRMTASSLVRGFNEAFPNATISIAEGLSEYLIEWLMIGRLDAAVLYDTSITPLIEKRELVEQELFLIGPESTVRGKASVLPPIPFKQIDRYKLIMPSRMHGVRHTIESRAAELGLRLNIAIEVDAVTSILDLIADGLGNAVLTETAIASDPAKRKFTMQRFTKPTPSLQMVLATCRRQPLSRLATKALKVVEKSVLSLYTLPTALQVDSKSRKT